MFDFCGCFRGLAIGSQNCRQAERDRPRRLSSWNASTSAMTFSYLCAVK